MSRSPKYSFAQMTRQIRDALRREQDVRRRRRRDAADRERRRAVTEAATRHRAGAAGLTAAAAATGRQADLAGALDRLGAAGTPEELAEAVAGLDRTRRDIERLRTEAALRERASVRDKLESLRAELSRVTDRAALDPAGAREIDAQLAGTGAADPDALAAAVGAHLDRVSAARAAAEREREEAGALVDRLADRLETLRADARVARVPLADDERAGEAIAMLHERIAARDVTEVPLLGAALSRRLDGIEDGLDEVIDQISERRAILGSLVKALPAVGFAVDAGSLTENPDGTIGLRAVRAGGEAMAVLVTAEEEGGHRVRYASETVRRETGPGPACDSLLDVINALHVRAEHDGVVLSGVTWDGRDDDPSSGGAIRLPHQTGDAVRREARP
ncbi:hypothetical protein [Actinoplanes sp. NBRC 103695]|uniref:hypothetical protein n=1 Tax=Actinoplanes sp. NBRC 103695 TaxID=3032202 RepID=UPI0024A38CCD|nr:hypothetical protein [Actinoplanes sp. NBRC 103695]GLY98464.1 hypothetical protein Acsp02_57180 [Actinoplanes sp. NBRC 103695]